MMFGKKARPPIKRTTSMTEFSLDSSLATTYQAGGAYYPQPLDPTSPFSNSALYNKKPTTTDTPPPTRRHSADFLEAASFLRACSLCKRPFIPDRDIFMYRGDTAFCSLECRQQQMNQDQRKERSSFVSKKEVVSLATRSEVPSTGETVLKHQ